MTQRRAFLIWVGVAFAAYGLRAPLTGKIFARLPPFESLPGLAPFRRISLGGATSASTDFLLGMAPLDSGSEARRVRAEAVRLTMCRALFRQEVVPGVVPIAYFSEFRCPYCRALEGELDKVLADTPGTVRLVQHELPIFGPPSEFAARASLAAARQGKQQELRKRLMRSPLVPDPGLISRLAVEVGLDPHRLLADMAGPDVQADLDTTRALADVLGIVGTPALVIGRTVLNGAVDADTIERIIAQERKELPLAC